MKYIVEYNQLNPFISSLKARGEHIIKIEYKYYKDKKIVAIKPINLINDIFNKEESNNLNNLLNKLPLSIANDFLNGKFHIDLNFAKKLSGITNNRFHYSYFLEFQKLYDLDKKKEKRKSNIKYWYYFIVNTEIKP